MDGLRIVHLTFTGSTEPASVEFGRGLTLVRGPSDTGKSFMVDAIDFALGKSSLKEIPERYGYRQVLLGVEMPDGRVVTLVRSVEGGKIDVYNRDLRQLPTGLPDLLLNEKHHQTNDRNISAFLLNELGLRDRRIRKNSRGDTNSLSFRNLAHLCIVDETQMQSETPPALTGSYVTKTAELSVLRMMIEDDDDSSLDATAGSSQERALTAGQIALLSEMLSELRSSIENEPAAAELREQLARLVASIAASSASMSAVRSERSDLTTRQRTSLRERATAASRRDETETLLARLALLNRQYESDLNRLDTLREAGSLMGFFDTGACPFCGAEPEHQHLNNECAGDLTYLEESIDAEHAKTFALRTDLSEALRDLADESEFLNQRLVCCKAVSARNR